MLTSNRRGIGLMTERWSDRVGERFSLALDPESIAWFDGGWWHPAHGGEFQNPLPPEELLVDAPDCIWAGFMLPDTIPVISNRYGDWLCWRVDSDNRLSEVLHWYHGGGDWLPFGKRLSEAIALDCTRVASPSAAYASNLVSGRAKTESTLWQWACGQLGLPVSGVEPSAVVRPLDSKSIQAQAIQANHSQSGHSEIEHALGAFWASSPAVIFEQIIGAIDWPLRAKAEPGIARRFQINWEPDMVRWIFDANEVPQPRRQELCELLSLHSDLSRYQNWDQAAELARTIVGTRADIGWAYDILGWSLERSGRLEEAIDCYFQGCFASVFSDQSITVRTHWYDERFRKFSAARLYHHYDRLPESLKQNDYLKLLWFSPLREGRSEIRRYWMSKGDAEMKAGEPAAAYESYYRAGWDVGSHELPAYREILEGLIAAAEGAGWRARAAVAGLHLKCLLSRVGRSSNG
jgi:hypothetical protein